MNDASKNLAQAAALVSRKIQRRSAARFVCGSRCEQAHAPPDGRLRQAQTTLSVAIEDCFQCSCALAHGSNLGDAEPVRDRQTSGSDAGEIATGRTNC